MAHPIILKRNFTSYTHGKNMAEVFEGASIKLNNYYNNSGLLETGLTLQEQKYLLPEIIKCEPTDKNFYDAIQKYYEAFQVALNDGGVLTLDIELANPEYPLIREEKEKDKIREIYNPPNNILEYLKYRFAKVHPLVALGTEVGDTDTTKHIVLIDTKQEGRKLQVTQEFKKQANLHYYAEVANSPDNVEMYHFIIFNNQAGTLEQKQAAITHLIETNPERYVDTKNDSLLTIKYLLRKAHTLRIIDVVNGDWIYKEDMKNLGKNLDEASKFLNSNEIYLAKIQNQVYK